MPTAAPRRARAIAALTGACLVGAATAVAVMWVAGPAHVETPTTTAVAARAATTAVFSPGGVPSEALAKRMAPSLVQVQAGTDGQWKAGTAL